MYPRVNTVQHSVAFIVCLVIALAVGLAPSHVAAASGSPAIHGTGTWINDGPCAPVPPPPTIALACTGRTIWNGPLLTGKTLYTAFGNVTPTGNILGVAYEIFWGYAENGARGTIRFHEVLSLKATGEVFIVADAVGGTGGFCHVTAHLVFTGTSNPQGIGNGSYAGSLVTPNPCG